MRSRKPMHRKPTPSTRQFRAMNERRSIQASEVRPTDRHKRPGVRYVIEQIRAGKPIEQNAFLVMLIALCGFTILFGRFFCGYACAFGTLGDGMYALSQWIQKKVKKEASVGIRRNRTETAKNEIYSVISLNADLCIRIYEKVPRNQSLGSIFPCCTQVRFQTPVI